MLFYWRLRLGRTNKEAQKGNKDAFTKIIKQINEDLYKIARTRISNKADIDHDILKL